MGQISYSTISQKLAALDIAYNSTYTTPEAIYSLKKTLKTFGITIVDWNTLITCISTTGSTLQALYQIVPELAQYVHEQVEQLSQIVEESAFESVEVEVDTWDEYEFATEEV